MSWFTKYRPTQVGGLHLQTVRDGLTALMKSGSFPHALLFAGPKGTGKTSSARIVGAMLNDMANAKLVDYIFFAKAKPTDAQLKEPDPTTDLAKKIYAGHSYVVNEMDAASNRGIDDIRQLKERLNLPPQEGKIAVYILDEVHMLTTEAFNALLKVLEEPPAHVVFILATTEKHKLPATIVSRCSEISFHKASIAEITSALENVLDQEKIPYQVEALEQIGKQADGSFRDAVKIIETIATSAKKVDLEALTVLHFNSLDQDIFQLVEALLHKDEKQVISKFINLRERNIQTKFFYQSLMNYLHDQLLLSLGVSQGESQYSFKVLNFLLNNFNQVVINPNSPIELLDLELKFLELIVKSKEKTAPVEQKKNPNAPKVVACEAEDQIKSVKILEPELEEEEIIEESENIGCLTQPIGGNSHSNLGNGQQLLERWSDFLSSLKDKNLSLELLLRSSKPIQAEGNKIVIQVFYSFHQEQLQQQKFLSQIVQCMVPVAGGLIEPQFVVAKVEKDQISDTPNFQLAEDDDLVELAKQALV